MATFAWNSQEHLEVYLAAPSMGAVLHTLNIRLAGEQLTYIANHAEDKVVFVDDSLVPVLEKVAPTFETVKHFVVIGDGDSGSLPNVLRYEELLGAQSGEFDYPEIDDRMAAALCYTSGTTGNPKGVLYSHRSTLLHVDRGADRRQHRPAFDGSRAARSPDVPRERLGARPCRTVDGRGPRDAEPLPPGRAARQADRGGEGDGGRRRADDLARPPELRGRERRRPFVAPLRAVRRVGGAAVAHAGVQGAPRSRDPPGVGHDGNEPCRLRCPSAEGRW